MSRLEILREQAAALAGWVDGLEDADLDRASVLPGWRVAELVAHVGLLLQGVDRPPTRDKPLTIAQYVAGYAEHAAAIADRERAAAAGRSPAELRAMLRTEVADSAARTVQAPRGPLRRDDWLTTRVVELVVHADDLARSLDVDREAPLTRPALKLTVTTLAKALAERAPGHSVELRVPPYAAVQCVEGPRHTRGTPPNVVETDPLTWVRLAAGRLGWDDATATGSARASGGRADLGPWLPIL